MKFRQAKKIIEGHTPNWREKCRKLRPPYEREDGKVVCPSWHDIDIIRRAMRVYLRHVRRNNKNRKK